ncbi:unnamed protein product, partial [Choristocarpus tenellus]
SVGTLHGTSQNVCPSMLTTPPTESSTSHQLTEGGGITGGDAWQTVADKDGHSGTDAGAVAGDCVVGEAKALDERVQVEASGGITGEGNTNTKRAERCSTSDPLARVAVRREPESRKGVQIEVGATTFVEDNNTADKRDMEVEMEVEGNMSKDLQLKKEVEVVEAKNGRKIWK